jgi:hypothetical protein
MHASFLSTRGRSSSSSSTSPSIAGAPLLRLHHQQPAPLPLTAPLTRRGRVGVARSPVAGWPRGWWPAWRGAPLVSAPARSRLDLPQAGHWPCRAAPGATPRWLSGRCWLRVAALGPAAPAPARPLATPAAGLGRSAGGGAPWERGRPPGAAWWGRKGRGRGAVALPPVRERRGARHGCWWISTHGKGGGGRGRRRWRGDGARQRLLAGRRGWLAR